jgi:hypothetical protein
LYFPSQESFASPINVHLKRLQLNAKRLVNTSLPPDVELGAGWDACIASLGRPAAQEGIKALIRRGFHKPGDVENRLGYYLGQNCALGSGTPNTVFVMSTVSKGAINERRTSRPEEL